MRESAYSFKSRTNYTKIHDFAIALFFRNIQQKRPHFGFQNKNEFQALHLYTSAIKYCGSMIYVRQMLSNGLSQLRLKSS